MSGVRSADVYIGNSRSYSSLGCAASTGPATTAPWPPKDFDKQGTDLRKELKAGVAKSGNALDTFLGLFDRLTANVQKAPEFRSQSARLLQEGRTAPTRPPRRRYASCSKAPPSARWYRTARR